MDWLRILFSKNGTLPPKPFWFAAVGVYLAGPLSQSMLSRTMVDTASIIPFAAFSCGTLWVWYAIHAKRLSDAGRKRWPAIVIFWFLALMLLIVLSMTAIFLALETKDAEGAPASSVLGLYVLLAMFGVLFGVFDPTGFAPFIIGLFLVMLGPAVLSIAFSIWAGTRPSLTPPLQPALIAPS